MSELIISGSVSDIIVPEDYQPVTVVSGGTLSNGTVNSGGTVSVSGGTLINAVINSNGAITMDGGVISGLLIAEQSDTTPYELTVNAGTVYNISGNVKDQILVTGQDSVISGGTIIGRANVGWTNLKVSSGASIYNVSTTAGAVIITIGKDATSYKTSLCGVNYNATNNGVCGNEFVDGGTASGTICNDHAIQTVSNGGQAYDTLIYGGYGTLKSYQSVGYKGTAYRTVIGKSSDMTLGGQQIVTGTSAYAYMTKIVGSGLQLVSGGGQVYDTVLGEWGVQELGSGGIAYRTQVGAIGGASGGTQNVYANGIASDTTILANGLQVVSNGGNAIDDVLTNGASVKVEDGGTVSIQFTPWAVEATVESAAGATVTYLERDANVYCGNADSGITAKGNTVSGVCVNDNDVMTVYQGGVIVDTDLIGSGSLLLSGGMSFGGANNNIAAGKITDVNGNVLEGVSLIGDQMTLDGAIAADNMFTVVSGLTLTMAGTAQASLITLVAGNGGTISGVNASFKPATGQNATILVSNGGVSINNTMGMYRQETVNNGGKSYNLTVNGLGATQWVQGTSYNTKVIYGNQYLNAATSIASGTLIYNGGLTAYNNAKVFDAVLMENTASLYVNRGATANNTAASGGLIELGRTGDTTLGYLTGVTTLHKGATLNVISGSVSTLDLVTDASYDFGTGAAETYTINGNALVDSKYFHGNTAYVLDESNLAVTVDTTGAYFSKLSTQDAQLTEINTDDGNVTYAGTISGYIGGGFFATKGDALTSGAKVIVDIADNTGATVCGGANGGTISKSIEVNLTAGSANFIYGGGKSFNAGETVVNATGGTVRTVYAGALLTSDGAANGSTTLNLAGNLTGSAFGGNRVNGGAVTATAAATVNVSSGATVASDSFVAGAGFVVNGGLTLDAANVNWNGGNQADTMTFGRGVVVGGIAGTSATLSVANANGTFTDGMVNYIYGGVWAQNGATGIVTNKVTLSVTGGDHGYVYGGGIALGDTSTSTVNDVAITVSGNTQLLGVFAGGKQSNGENTINGVATVTLKDAADIAKFVNGEGDSCTLALDGFTGTLGGVSGFGTVNVSGATAVGGEFQMVGDATSSWDFDLTNATAGTALMNWVSNSKNDFEGDTINLTFDAASTSSWTLITMAGDKASSMLELFESTNIIYNDGATTNWELKLQDEHSLILVQKANA